MRPDYEYNENEGTGWSIEVLEKKGRYSRVKFLGIPGGVQCGNEWIETSMLRRIQERYAAGYTGKATRPPLSEADG